MLLNILIAWITLSIVVTLFWFWSCYKKNPSVIDVAWSLGVLVAGTLFVLLGNNFGSTNHLILAYWILLVIWSLRLSSYLYATRIRKNQIDQRYLDVSHQWRMNKALGFFLHYQFQAVLMLIVSIPFLFIAQVKTISILSIHVLIMSIILISIIAESIADYQLYKHKKDKPKVLCDQGLWHYSRHPNYFFEWLVWVGFSIAALSSPWGYLSLLSPCLLLYLFLFVTGPITEKNAIKSKGDSYILYQKRTSMFVPWFKRRLL